MQDTGSGENNPGIKALNCTICGYFIAKLENKVYETCIARNREMNGFCFWQSEQQTLPSKQ